MAGAKNRRQGPAAASPERNGANGNAAAHVTAKSIADDEPRENIFLLWPNIIGTSRLTGIAQTP